MPRSTRHKSSKHKDARDHSDSEKEEKKSSSAIRVSGSGEKRGKEYYDNGEYYEEYTSSSSKRRRGKGGEDEKGESSKKSKVGSEKSSRRREEGGDGEEVRKSSSGKHRESSRRESKEVDKDNKKYKEGKSEKLYDGGDDHHRSKGLSDKSESKAEDQQRSLGTENHTEKRSRRKRDDHGAGDKNQDNSDDDYVKDGKHRGEKSRDKYQEDKDEDVKPTGEKQREDRPSKEHHRSDGKLLPDESKRKSKIQDTDHGHEPDSELDGYHERDRDRDRARDRDRDYERERDRDRDRERDRDRRDYDHDRYYGRDWDRDRSRDRDRDHDRDRTHEREKDRSSRDYYHEGKRSKSDRERDNDRDASRLDDQSGRYRDRREGRKSPDYQEVVMDTRSSRAGPDGDVIKSERQPSSSVVQEENGNVSDQTTKWVSSREAAELSGGSDRGTRQKASEKTIKTEDGVLGEFHGSTKASPRPMVERSPSSTSLDRRFNNQSSARWSSEVEDRNNARDFSAPEDERLRVDDASQGDIAFNNKPNQNNSSFPPRPESRSGMSSPRVGLREDDNRVNTGGRYRRGVDGMMGRGQTQGNNAWRGVPSWPAPLANGFIPFQPHGFQAMMPQYPSPSIFGVRPSMEMNHSGIPYHIPDAERFSGHMRPLGWQNMMDNAGASSHMHGFFGDMSNSAFRDESNMYGGSEWDHNRRMQSRGWESGADEWKNRNGDASMEVSSRSAKDDNSAQVADGESPGGQTSHSENNRGKSVEAGSNLTSPAKELDARSPKIKVEVAAEDPVTETTDKRSERFCRHYLSKLDMSVELTDPELSKCISLLMGEEHQPIDDGAAVFVNLKEGGKRVPKGNGTSLATLSLFPPQNSSLFQIAMELYKEQRFEIKGLLNVEIHRPPQASPSSLAKVDVSDSDTSEKEHQNVSLPVYTGLEIGTQAERSSSPIPEKLSEALESPEALVSDHIEGCEKDGKPDDGGAVDQTMDMAPEHDAVEGEAVTEGEPVTLTIASPEAIEAMEVDEGKVLCEDKEMEEAEEKEVEGDDGNGGVVSPKVKESLVNETDDSVISQIHDATQSTH
ncbi:hypothetical protein Bca52824_095953 [Brassica carinata]|uniref:Uncharacterized protein n=1 Tax=Brassica carinata TaxID=52824 RepID=A0A8X7THT0_BRACI|nr:hypothetical protein Bca52824_095953 [Brassica carinata]